MAELDRLRKQDAAFARAHLCRVADPLGITESRRLLGRRVLARAPAIGVGANAGELSLARRWSNGSTLQARSCGVQMS